MKGKFPDYLLDAWDDYDFRKDSDNDRPGKDLHTNGLHVMKIDCKIWSICHSGVLYLIYI